MPHIKSYTRCGSCQCACSQLTVSADSVASLPALSGPKFAAWVLVMLGASFNAFVIGSLLQCMMQLHGCGTRSGPCSSAAELMHMMHTYRS